MRLPPAFACRCFFLAAALSAVALAGGADEAALPGLVTTLKGHSESIYAIAFTPDGRHVVTGSGDRSVKVWETATGKELKTFAGTAGHQNLVLGISISPDGSLIASGSSDNTTRIWDFPSSSPLRTLPGSARTATLAVSPDGTRLAGGGSDGMLRIWNIADGKEMLKLTGHTGAITGLAFHANGQILASAGSDRTLRFWNLASGQPLAVFAAHAGPIRGIAFQAGGNLLASAGEDGLLKYWNLPPGPRPALPSHTNGVTALTLAPDNNVLVSGSADRTVHLTNLGNSQLLRSLPGAAGTITSVACNGPLVAAGTAGHHLLVWQAADGQMLANAPAHAGAVTSLAFQPGTSHLLTAGADGALRLWAMPPMPSRTLPQPDAVGAAAIFPDSKHVLTGGADKILRVWNLAAPQQPERQFSGPATAISAVAVAADGRTLASAGEDFIRLWDLTNGQQTALLGAHHGVVTSLAFGPGGQLLSASADGSLKLWTPPPAHATAIKLYAHPGEVTAAVLSPDGSRLLTGCADHQVRLWNLASGQVERTFAGAGLGILSVASSLDGTRVAAGSADKSARIWDLASGREIKSFPLPFAVAAIGFTADAKTLMAGLADGSLRWLDLASGKETRSLPGHAGVTALLCSPKGDLLTGGSDQTVRIWSADGKERQVLKHGAAIKALALSKDGTRLASGGMDNAIKVWSLSDGKLLTTIATPTAVQGVAFAPDGSTILAGGADGRTRLYGLDGRLREFFLHEGPVSAVAFHADGKHVYTASADRTARPWTLSLSWMGHHEGGVRRALFAPGNRIVSGGADKTIRIWNDTDGKLLRTVSHHEGPITGLAVSNDGRVASTAADKTLRLWPLDPPAGKPTPPLVLPLPAAADAVAFRADGKHVAISMPGIKSGDLRIFDSATGRLVQWLEGHAGEVRSLEFLSDGRTLLSAGSDKVLRLADANVLSALDAHPGGVTGIAFHPAGNLLITGGADKTLKLWNPATGQLVKALATLPEPVEALVINRAGTQLAAAWANSVRVWSIPDGKEVRTLPHGCAVHGVALSADGSRLVTAGADKLAHVWELATGRELAAFPHTGAVRAVVCPSSNNDLVLSADDDHTIAVNQMNLARIIANDSPLQRLIALPNGQHFIAADDMGRVKFWNMAGNADRTFADTNKPVRALAASRNGVLLAAGGEDQSIRLYSLPESRLLSTIAAPAAVRSLAFTADSQGLLGLCGESAVQSWNVAYQPGQPLAPEFGKPSQSYTAACDLASAPAVNHFYTAATTAVQVWRHAGDAPTKVFAHPNLVDCVAFSPDGTQLATGCHDGRLRIFDVAKGQQLRDIAAHVAPPTAAAIYCLAWTADGKRIVSGSYDRSLKLWNAADGKQLVEFKAHDDKKFPRGHRDGVYCLALSPDGNLLASGGGDRAIKIWNLADGSVVRELSHPAIRTPPLPGGASAPQAHPGYVYGLRFTPDGKYILSVGAAPHNRGSLIVWNAADGQLLSSHELSVGTLLALNLSPDGKLLALGTGGTIRDSGPMMNNAYILKLPLTLK